MTNESTISISPAKTTVYNLAKGIANGYITKFTGDSEITHIQFTLNGEEFTFPEIAESSFKEEANVVSWTFIVNAANAALKGITTSAELVEATWILSHEGQLASAQRHQNYPKTDRFPHYNLP